MWLDDVLEGLLWATGVVLIVGGLLGVGILYGSAQEASKYAADVNELRIARDEARGWETRYYEAMAGRLGLASDELRQCLVEAARPRVPAYAPREVE